ncbi:MAG: hypothetical protein C4523_03880 [Myxococcales bacterium]|nr:MAG: hypothetical protein C4523_03880 [Myxococcales bacterium]
MLVQLTADVHGAHERLKSLCDPDLPLWLLGDNLNLVDFHSLGGVASRVLRKRDIARILFALSAKGAKAALAVADDVFFRNPEVQRRAEVEISKEYNKLKAILPPEATVLHGNVDWPDLLAKALGATYLDAGVKELAGVRVGFLSGTGAYPYSMRLPGERPDEEYAKLMWSLGKVDILCTHFPPAVDGLTYDAVATRDEGGGRMLNDYLLEMKPKLHFFGHIHNPQLAEAMLGETRLVNVGGFRARGKLFVLNLDSLEVSSR